MNIRRPAFPEKQNILKQNIDSICSRLQDEAAKSSPPNQQKILEPSLYYEMNFTNYFLPGSPLRTTPLWNGLYSCHNPISLSNLARFRGPPFDFSLPQVPLHRHLQTPILSRIPQRGSLLRRSRTIRHFHSCRFLSILDETNQKAHDKDSNNRLFAPNEIDAMGTHPDLGTISVLFTSHRWWYGQYWLYFQWTFWSWGWA